MNSSVLNFLCCCFKSGKRSESTPLITKAKGSKERLFEAVTNKTASHLDVIKQILEPINPEERQDLVNSQKDGQTLAHITVTQKQNLATLEYLVQCGADIEKKDPDGRTVLHAAVSSEWWEGMQCIISQPGVDINTRDEKHNSVFHTVAKKAEPQATRAMASLLETPNRHPKILDNQDNHGQTALHIAAYKGNQGMVLALLAAGASPNIKDSIGTATPKEIASHEGHAEIAHLIELREQSLNLESFLQSLHAKSEEHAHEPRQEYFNDESKLIGQDGDTEPYGFSHA
jgi:ankyrin repeat protein